MRKLLALVCAAVGVGLSAGAASAVPCGPTTCAPVSTTSAASNALLVRPKGLHGPLAAFDLATGRSLARLPEGVLSADGRRYVTRTFAVGGPGTRVIRYAAATGRKLDSWIAPGPYSDVGAVSASGRFAALVAGDRDPHVTIVDLDRRSVLRTVDLKGQWQVDALSRDGSRLYLLEYTTNGSYRVRADVAGQGLLPGPITDPSESEPMTGMPWSSIGTPDGRWQLTLFVKTAENRNEAFIHALSLDRAEAKCIDLSAGSFMAIGRYALVLSPDGRTLYAANPSLGVVQTVDLERRAVSSTTRFVPTTADDSMSTAFGAITRDGRSLYFSAGRGVHVYDTRSATVRRLRGAGDLIGVGVAPSARSLLVVRPSQQVVKLDARTGGRLRA
jgi:hypothetical protein